MAFIYGISVKFSYQEVFICRGLVKFLHLLFFFFFLIKIQFLSLWDSHTHSRWDYRHGKSFCGNVTVFIYKLKTKIDGHGKPSSSRALTRELFRRGSHVQRLNPHCTLAGLSCFLHARVPSCHWLSPCCRVKTVCCLFNRHKTSAR